MRGPSNGRPTVERGEYLDLHPALMDRPRQALAQLREAIDAGWRGSWWITFSTLKDDPYLGELQDDPEFRAMVVKVEADIARMRNRAMQAEASGNWQPLLALAESGARFAAETPPH
jgi:flagellar biosynthesis regulator FlaF